MKIIIAPDSFKGSLSAPKAADCIENGVMKVFFDAETVKIPIADGGEGTVEAMLAGAGGELRYAKVKNPLGVEISAAFGLLSDGRAVIETAAASGLTLIPQNKRNPLITSTYGTGQLIKAALDTGCKSIIIGLGGSATNDGGAGMVQALGALLLDEEGLELAQGGANLLKLKTVDLSGLDKRLLDTEVIIASDVRNPLCGANGASVVFGPQKGACPDMVRLLDRSLARYNTVVSELIGCDYSLRHGAGAAGGLGYGLMAFCGAVVKQGIDIVLDASNFDSRLKTADLVITGEGKMDGQSLMGKAPVGVALRAKEYGVPVLAIVGSIGGDINEAYFYGISAVMSCAVGASTIEELCENAEENLTNATERAMRILKTGMATTHLQINK